MGTHSWSLRIVLGRYQARAGNTGIDFERLAGLMGYNARNDEIHENLERMRREREAYEDSLAIVRQFNARLSAKKPHGSGRQ